MASKSKRMAPPKIGPSETNIINKEIGRRIQARREELGLTQTDLGRHLGVTYQSVQKYERGARISAGGLVKLAQILEIEPRALFRGLDRYDVEAPGFAEEGAAAYEVPPFLGREAMEMVRHFNAIQDKAVRKRLLDLAATLAREGDPVPARGRRRPGGSA
jgi:transcriptional regulator with XRE-family HTH domain